MLKVKRKMLETTSKQQQKKLYCDKLPEMV